MNKVYRKNINGEEIIILETDISPEYLMKNPEYIDHLILRERDRNMPVTMEHERKRFSQMTELQLWSRLGKITTVEKLNNFIRLAKEYNYPDLEIAAKGRLFKLTGQRPSLPSIDEEQEDLNIERVIRRLDL